IVSGKDDDDKEAELDKIGGVQNYALNFEGGSYTIDWASPSAMPLFVGVELYNAFVAKEPSSIISTIARITDPAFELSMLQGINDAIKSTTYSEANPIVSAMESAAFNYAGQFVPTILGQTARTLDGTRRQTYVDKNSLVPPMAQRFLQKQQAKIPVLSQKLMPYKDQFGREQTEENVAIRAFQNFVSPGYISKDRSTGVEKELKRLYKEVDDTKVLPNYAPKHFTVNGENKNLTSEEYEQFATTRGQTAYRELAEIMKGGEYKKLPSEEQADVVRKAYEYALNKGKAEVSDYSLEKQPAKIDENPYKYILAYGVCTGYTKKAEKIAQLRKLGYTNTQAEDMYKEMRDYG
ncbi:MAG: hypothetical protein RR728_06970, partial [Oscillospiraceae bacterium]